MESNNFIRVCGSIVKMESLAALKSNILENTCVAEANLPYANYYGSVPLKGNPNSLFLFTKQYYTLEEVLRFSQKITSCVMEKVNVASSVLKFQNSQTTAIRIKNLPDYQHLAHIQECFANQGVEFAKRTPIEKEALVKTNKCFILEEIDEEIFMDVVEENKGYILIEKLLTQEEFFALVKEIRNNSECRLFDAAKGGIIVDSEVKEIIRIYSEHLDITELKYIQTKIRQILKLKPSLVG